MTAGRQQPCRGQLDRRRSARVNNTWFLLRLKLVLSADQPTQVQLQLGWKPLQTTVGAGCKTNSQTHTLSLAEPDIIESIQSVVPALVTQAAAPAMTSASFIATWHGSCCQLLDLA